MSSPDRRAPVRSAFARAFACALTLAAGAGLSGCMQPLYGSLASGGDGSMSSRLQAIKVAEIPDRIGHYLENELTFGFNGTGAPVAPRYLLKVTVHETTQSPLIDTVTGFPTSGTVVITADYSLAPLTGGDAIASGSVHTFSSYDRNSNRFANIRAARDAEIRDAKLLADQIRVNISAQIAQKG